MIEEYFYSITEIKIMRSKISKIAKIQKKTKLKILSLLMYILLIIVCFVMIFLIIDFTKRPGIDLLTQILMNIISFFIAVIFLVYLHNFRKNFPFIYTRLGKKEKDNLINWSEDIISQMRICAVTNEFIYIYCRPKSFFILKKESDIDQFNRIKTILKSKRNRFCKYYEDD